MYKINIYKIMDGDLGMLLLIELCSFFCSRGVSNLE